MYLVNMKVPKGQPLTQAADLLAKHLNAKSSGIRLPSTPGPDALLDLAGHTFVLEYRQSSATAPIAAAVEQVLSWAKQEGGKTIPLLVVPFMGEAGSKRCKEAGVSWLDLSGNADITAEGLQVKIKGEPNRFKSRGRPASPFAPKSSRISRWFLVHPRQRAKQKEIAEATGIGEGYTSRIIRQLKQQQFIQTGDPKGLRATNPDLLLDAWHEYYDFSKHRVIRGHIPARSGTDLVNRIAEHLEEQRQSYAFTGLAAAWSYTHFVSFRLAALYLGEEPSSAFLEELHFRKDPKGANTWLVVPNDSGVFYECRDLDRVRCVHPVQAYLDLKGHPERSQEAADRLRAEELKWGQHA